MRGFAGKDPVNEPVPDETTFCKFRHLLERKRLDKAIFSAVNQHPQASGLMVSSGTNVDTTLIAAPSSTKNQERDPEVKRAKKGNHRHVGIKTHIGTDSRTVLGHSVMVTPATPCSLREALRESAPRARDFTRHRRDRNRPLTELQVGQNRTKSSVRAKVEHA